MKLHLDRAAALFDRLCDGEYMTEVEWDRVGPMLAFEGLVRAEKHPMYCAYFSMKKNGAVPLARLEQILTEKGLDPKLLSKVGHFVYYV